MSAEIIVRRPYLRVLINGVELSNRLSAQTSFGYDMQTGAATIVVPELTTTIRAWDSVEIFSGSSQGSARQRFRGYFVNFDYSLWPKAIALQCRGVFSLAELTTNNVDGGTSFANSGLGTPDEEQVEHVLTECGVTDKDIEGTGVNIGSFAVDEVVWEEGQTGLGYIQRLDEICLGYRTYDTPGGTVVRRQITPHPSSSSVYTFTEGVDIVSGSLNTNPMEIRNRIYVEGYDNGDGPVFAIRQQASPSLPPGTQYVTEELRSTLIERTDEASAGAGLTAAEVAEWQVLQNNVLRHRVTFDTPRDEYVQPGMTITVNAPIRLGYAANYWVQSVTTNVTESGFTQTIAAIGGPGSDSDIEAPPIIDFTFRVERELVIIDNALTDLWVIYAEDLSFGQSAEIVARDWALTGGNPSTGEGVTFTGAVTTLSGATLTLTITDSNGLQESRTKSVDVPEEEQKRRRMFTAAEVSMEAFDGTEWRTQLPSNEAAVAEVAHGPLWIAGERIYYSLSALADPPEWSLPFSEEIGEGEEATLVATANPSAIWAELDVDDNLIMAGADNGRLAISTDAAQTWEEFDGPQIDAVVRCVISRYNPNHLYVMYADALWESHDGGITWVRLVRNHPETNEVFRDLNVSFERMMIAMSGGRLLIDGRSDAQQVLPVLEPAITEVSCVTANIREDKFYAIDSQGRTLATIEAGGIEWEQRANVPEGTTPQWRGLWRDGDIPGLLYMALGTGGVWKSIDAFQSVPGYYLMRSPGFGNSSVDAIHRRVGLDGRLQDAPPSGRVYLLGSDGIAVRIGRNQWALLNDAGFSVGDSYRLMAVDSADPDRLYVLSNNGAIARSINGGQNWTILSHGISGMTGAGVWISPGYDTLTLYAANGSGGEIHRSTDGGDNWSLVYSASGAYQVRDFGHRIWFGALTGVPTRWVRYTDNDFASTTAAGFSGGTGGLGGRFAVSPDAPGTVYHWRQNTGTDFQRWRDTPQGPTNIKPGAVGGDGTVRWAEAAGQNTVLCIATLEGGGTAVFRSMNQGDNWSTVIGPDLIEGAGYERPQVAVNPDVSNQWWVAEGNSSRRRVFSSTDDGLTWEVEVCDVGVGSAIRQILVTGGVE